MLWMRQKILSWGMGFFWYHIETFFMFQTLSFILINKTFTFKRLSSDKFSFARNIWACLSANITIHNVVIGIINQLQWATKTMTSRRLWIYTFQLQNPNLHQYFGLCFHQSYIRQASFVNLTGLFLVKHFVKRFCFFVNHRVTCKC
jgi:hypothetical protein